MLEAVTSLNLPMCNRKRAQSRSIKGGLIVGGSWGRGFGQRASPSPHQVWHGNAVSLIEVRVFMTFLYSKASPDIFILSIHLCIWKLGANHVFWGFLPLHLFFSFPPLPFPSSLPIRPLSMSFPSLPFPSSSPFHFPSLLPSPPPFASAVGYMHAAGCWLVD